MDTGSRTGARVVAGRYRLVEPLGSGGMGTVWRAEDAVLRRQVAVKEVVFPRGLSDAERETLRERTRREARVAARLDHPSAVTVYDVVEEDGQPWLVLELVEARTLAEVVRVDGPLTPARTAQVGLAVLGALEAAHAQGIVHRDVKPSNVLVRDDGRVVLTDFGIATSAGDSSITSTGLLLGSPSYIAPERARGEAPGPASDLWSLGATLFTAVEGRPPYDRGEPLPTLTAVVTDDREPYVAAGPLVPLLDGLLEPDPGRRLDAGGARTLLQQVAAAGDAATGRAPRPQPEAEHRAQRTTAFPVTPAEAPPETPPTAPPTVAAAAPSASPATTSAAPPAAPSREPGPLPRRVQPVTRAAAPPTAGAPRSGRRRLPLVALAAVAALGLGAVGVVALDQARDGGTAPAPGTSTAPDAEQSGAPEGRQDATPGVDGEGGSPADVPGGDEPAAAPAGWRTHEGRPGWSVAVPADWRVGTYRNGPEYRDPQTGRTLRVETGRGRPDAVADREAAERTFSRQYPSYRRIAIRPVDYRGVQAADWEFTYSAGGADLRVLNRVLNVDGTGHSLFFQTRAADFPAAQEDLEQILASFRPAGS